MIRQAPFDVDRFIDALLRWIAAGVAVVTVRAYALLRAQAGMCTRVMKWTGRQEWSRLLLTR